MKKRNQILIILLLVFTAKVYSQCTVIAKEGTAKTGDTIKVGQKKWIFRDNYVASPLPIKEPYTGIYDPCKYGKHP